jgi:hypothetical protein
MPWCRRGPLRSVTRTEKCAATVFCTLSMLTGGGCALGAGAPSRSLTNSQVIGTFFSAGEGRDADQRTLELADVGADDVGEVQGDLVGDRDAVVLGLLAEDGDAGLEVGRLDVGDEAPVEAGDQSVLHALHLGGHAVGGDDDLLLGLVERVEDVEELVHRPVAAGDELDVVDQQDVALVAVAAAELVELVEAHRGDELVHEALGALVDDAQARPGRVDVVADRVQQVGLAEADAAVDEEGVEAGAGLVGGGPRGRGGELVAGALDEVLEAVAARELRRRGGDQGWRARRGCDDGGDRLDRGAAEGASAVTSISTS